MTIKDKALRVIEVIADGAVKGLTKKQTIGVYKFSHIAVGNCTNKHLDWKDELNRVFASMVKSGDIK